MKEIISCKICNKRLKGKQIFYCSLKCNNKAHQSYGAQQARGLRRKLELIERMGGKCCLCGYNKNLAALVFHHMKRELKEFRLDMRALSNRKKSRIESEIKKCILLCHNCHAEHHNRHLDLAQIHR